MKRNIAAIGAAFVLLLCGCGSDDEGGSGTDTSSDAGSGGEESSSTTSTTTTTTEPETGIDEGLVGQWTADASETLAANMSNLGMPAGITCSGPITLTFNGDGTFTSGGTATCAAGAMSVSATLNTTGTWAVTGDGVVEVSGAVSDGSFDIPGIDIPAIDVVSDGSFDYGIEGNTLTITFTDPDVGTVTQTWTRV